MSSGPIWMFAKPKEDGATPEERSEIARGEPKEVEATSEERSEIASHWNAIRHYRDTGDSSRIDEFRGLTAAGEEYETDLDVIDEWLRRGDWGFEDIYDV